MSRHSFTKSWKIVRIVECQTARESYWKRLAKKGKIIIIILFFLNYRNVAQTSEDLRAQYFKEYNEKETNARRIL